MLTDQQISAVESAVAAFAPDVPIEQGALDLERACRQYLTMLHQQSPDAWKIQLAALQRANAESFNRVAAVIPSDKAQQLKSFIQANAGKPLPPITTPKPLSGAAVKIKP